MCGTRSPRPTSAGACVHVCRLPWHGGVRSPLHRLNFLLSVVYALYATVAASHVHAPDGQVESYFIMTLVPSSYKPTTVCVGGRHLASGKQCIRCRRSHMGLCATRIFVLRTTCHQRKATQHYALRHSVQFSASLCCCGHVVSERAMTHTAKGMTH